jgi:hypothetical protein
LDLLILLKILMKRKRSFLTASSAPVNNKQ